MILLALCAVNVSEFLRKKIMFWMGNSLCLNRAGNDLPGDGTANCKNISSLASERRLLTHTTKPFKATLVLNR